MLTNIYNMFWSELSAGVLHLSHTAKAQSELPLGRITKSVKQLTLCPLSWLNDARVKGQGLKEDHLL